jgi:hypothetical protein
LLPQSPATVAAKGTGATVENGGFLLGHFSNPFISRCIGQIFMTKQEKTALQTILVMTMFSSLVPHALGCKRIHASNVHERNHRFKW